MESGEAFTVVAQWALVMMPAFPTAWVDRQTVGCFGTDGEVLKRYRRRVFFTPSTGLWVIMTVCTDKALAGGR